MLDEYIGYHRINNLIHKVDDDLLSAVRVGLMDLRFAKPLGPAGTGFRRTETRIAKGLDFDLFSTTGADYD